MPYSASTVSLAYTRHRGLSHVRELIILYIPVGTTIKIICVGHQDDAVITELVHVKGFSDAASKSFDQILNFCALKDLFNIGFLGVKDFTEYRQYCLEVTVASLLTTSAC